MPFLDTGTTASFLCRGKISSNKLRRMCVLEWDKILRAAADNKTGDDL
jgi:hypothetical protein